MALATGSQTIFARLPIPPPQSHSNRCTYPHYVQAVYFDVLSALDKASLAVLQVPKLPTFSWHRDPKPSQRQNMAYPLLRLLLLHKILCSSVRSVVACWPCLWPLPTRTFHVPTCLCSCCKVVIATVPQVALRQMQHVAHLPSHIDALFSATAST
jgi:hypothetical protein